MRKAVLELWGRSQRTGEGVAQSMTELINNVREWARERNLHSAEPTIQLVKLLEETGELAKAHRKEIQEDIIDGVGDITVVSIIYCLQSGISFEDCLASAYEEIKNRKGRMVNGMFVKQEDLT